MPIVTTIAVALGITTAIGGGLWGLERHGRAQDRAEHAAGVQALHEGHAAEVATLSADLAECRARVTPESIDATGRVLQAAQVSELADVQLRAAVVAAMPQQTIAEAVIATGSPQSIAAYAGLVGCWSANTTGDSARSGCAREVPQAWAAAVAALAACPADAAP